MRSSAPRVRRDHVVPGAGLAGEPLALLDRALPARILDERLRPPVERLGLIEELVLGELGEALVHRLAIRTDELRQLHLVDRVQLPELARRLVERLEDGADLQLEMAGVEHVLERGQRRLVRRMRREDLAIDLDGALAIAELRSRGSDRGGTAASAISASPSASWISRRRISASSGHAPVVRVQTIEREHGRLVVELDVEDLAQRRDRLRRRRRAPARRRARGASRGRPGAARRATCRLPPQYSFASGSHVPVISASRSMWPSVSWLPESSRSARA